LIRGGLGPLIKKVDRKKINAAAIIAFVCLFALIIWMGLQNKDSIQNADSIDMNISQMLLMVVLGAVASATMIIPGVSGSLVLMLLGYYKAVTGALQTLAHGLLRFDFSAVGQPLLMLIPFLIGVALGIFGVAKLIEWLTARYPTITYCGVLGLVIASPVSLLIQTDMSGATAFIILISIVTFAVGFAGAFLLAKNSKE
jgi:putative membrane protein